VSGALLSGLRVLDLSLWQPGQYATRLLADLGAEVVKVEPPGGDRIRPDPQRFDDLNAGKSAVELDLKSPTGYAVLVDLVRDADVLVENLSTAVAERLGVVPARLHEVNPALVVCSVSGFGRTGPLSAGVGHDLVLQAHAGAMVPTPDGPVPMGPDTAGRVGGLAAAFAILAAVTHARATGRGEHVDVSITDVVASWVTARRPRTPVPHEAPATGTFRTADDRWLVLGIYSEDRWWDALCGELGLPGAVGLTMEQRAERAGELRAMLGSAIAGRDRDGLADALVGLGVPAGPVRDRDDVLAHPHFRARGTLVPGRGDEVRLGHPVRYAAHPAREPGPVPPPGRAPSIRIDGRTVA